MSVASRFAVLLVASLLVFQVEALACHCEAVCDKTADVTVIGPDYPATVTYGVHFSIVPTPDVLQCGTVTALSDSLLAPGAFDASLPFYFPDMSAKDDTLRYGYEFTWETCRALGGAPAADGSIVVENVATASFAGGYTDTCSRTIICRPPPDGGEGCSRTPGYWKTHSQFGPANDDPAALAAWAQVAPSGATSPFFNPPGTQTWFEVLWTDSSGGNAYYILARAYIAAKLNLFAGTSAPDEVDAALTYAETVFFPSYGPTSTLSKQVRASAIAWASVLDNYNNGLIGPGHCE